MNYQMINGINIIVDLPYPKITNIKKDLQLAYNLKKAYAGNISELTCISKYIYQHIELSDDFKEIKEAMRTIAIVEMRHLNILGNLIKKLGLDPTFTSYNSIDNEVYWESSYVNYDNNLNNIMLDNIKGEEAAIGEYKNIIKQTNDQDLQNILERIIIDEEQHIKIFQSILKNLI